MPIAGWDFALAAYEGHFAEEIGGFQGVDAKFPWLEPIYATVEEEYADANVIGLLNN